MAATTAAAIDPPPVDPPPLGDEGGGAGAGGEGGGGVVGRGTFVVVGAELTEVLGTRVVGRVVVGGLGRLARVGVAVRLVAVRARVADALDDVVTGAPGMGAVVVGLPCPDSARGLGGSAHPTTAAVVVMASTTVAKAATQYGIPGTDRLRRRCRPAGGRRCDGIGPQSWPKCRVNPVWHAVQSDTVPRHATATRGSGYNGSPNDVSASLFPRLTKFEHKIMTQGASGRTIPPIVLATATRDRTPSGTHGTPGSIALRCRGHCAGAGSYWLTGATFS
jgi:hypothetical protein